MSSEPQLAAEDLRLKLDFQKNVLDERLTEVRHLFRRQLCPSASI